MDELDLKRKLELIENELKICKARLKEVQQLSHIAQWHVDLTTGVPFWSDEDYRILGYRPGEVEPSWNLMLSHILPEDMDIIMQGREELFKNGCIESEYRIIQKGGEVRFIYSKNMIENDDQGKPILLRGVFRDITEYKNAEHEISRLKAALQKTSERD
jgi:PAS domain S-box-containing protein